MAAMPRITRSRADEVPLKIPLATATATRTQRSLADVPVALLERGTQVIARVDADRGVRVTQAARGLGVDAPVLKVNPGLLRMPGDTAVFDLAQPSSQIFGVDVRQVVHHGDGVSYMIPSHKGGAIFGVADVDEARAPGIYVATFVVSINASEAPATGFARFSLDYHWFEVPVVIRDDLAVFGFKVTEKIKRIDVGLEFPDNPDKTLRVVRRGELTKMT